MRIGDPILQAGRGAAPKQLVEWLTGRAAADAGGIDIALAGLAHRAGCNVPGGTR